MSCLFGTGLSSSTFPSTLTICSPSPSPRLSSAVTSVFSSSYTQCCSGLISYVSALSRRTISFISSLNSWSSYPVVGGWWKRLVAPQKTHVSICRHIELRLHSLHKCSQMSYLMYFFLNYFSFYCLIWRALNYRIDSSSCTWTFYRSSWVRFAKDYVDGAWFNLRSSFGPWAWLPGWLCSFWLS